MPLFACLTGAFFFTELVFLTALVFLATETAFLFGAAVGFLVAVDFLTAGFLAIDAFLVTVVFFGATDFFGATGFFGAAVGFLAATAFFLPITANFFMPTDPNFFLPAAAATAAGFFAPEAFADASTALNLSPLPSFAVFSTCPACSLAVRLLGKVSFILSPLFDFLNFEKKLLSLCKPHPKVFGKKCE